MLLEATMNEAEPSLMESMSERDRVALQRLKLLAGDVTSYPDLMTMLITDDSGDPFLSDYKETNYGFSVIKTQQPTCYANRAKANNTQSHLPSPSSNK
jgi:hypothetical protein